jgi:formiminoglutamase
MRTPIDMALWEGHGIPDPEAGAERWHQKVTPLTPEQIDRGEPGLALLGVCCDAGVKCDNGRPGAEKGPNAIRGALANQAWHLPVRCYDAGNLYGVDDDLEKLQGEQSAWVERLLDLGHFPLILGGGHEVALGSHYGLRRHLKRREERAVVGIINFDAHFDLRRCGRPSSATPFLQIAETCRIERETFRYLCVGVSEVANTAALFGSAGSVGAQWLSDEQLTPWNLAEADHRLADFLNSCDAVHLSVDLDIFPASAAPGVSVPTPRGVSVEVAEHLLELIKKQVGRKLKVADVAGCNPDFDIDGRTAKLAARLCHMIARSGPVAGGG